MKKIIMAILLLFVYLVSNAQEQSISDAKPTKSDGEELYKLWMKAFEHIDKYEYESPEKMLETLNSSRKLYEWEEKTYREITLLLTEDGFTYDKQNDTLLFVETGYAGCYIPSRYPSYFRAQSGSFKKDYSGNRQESGFTMKSFEPTIGDQLLMGHLSMLYADDVDGFRELYKKDGINFGVYDAWRIVLKDGKIVSSKMWTYSMIAVEHALDPEYNR